MKKLISLLAATGLVATTTSSVSACNKSETLAEATIAADKTSVEVTIESAKIKKDEEVTIFKKDLEWLKGSSKQHEEGKAKVTISVLQNKKAVRAKDETYILDVTIPAPKTSKEQYEKIGTVKVTVVKVATPATPTPAPAAPATTPATPAKNSSKK
ncbi:lipoprotein [Spiroplasma clarkii]|uniref:Lipoprotein n=1 Tax=Spiroplasma clarkii TaxID=2139 RepID=A0A2K8KGN3_9MOLU|nr:lipoprotein [Spiroplasma clarkii]ATX70850.1 hypothetical protein SCLAR_v1c05310 [Spiroplasma clarkii]